MATATSPSTAFPDCPICFEPYSLSNYPILTPCGHNLCSCCLSTLQETTCPTCRTQIPMNLRDLAQAFSKTHENKTRNTENPETTYSAVPRCPIHHKKLHSWCVNHKQIVCAHCKESPEHGSCEVKPNTEMDREIETLVTHVGKIVQAAERERREVAKMVEGHFEDAVKTVERVCEAAKGQLNQARATYLAKIDKYIDDKLSAYTQLTNELAPMDTAARRPLAENLRKLKNDMWERTIVTDTQQKLSGLAFSDWCDLVCISSQTWGEGVKIKLTASCKTCGHVPPAISYFLSANINSGNIRSEIQVQNGTVVFKASHPIKALGEACKQAHTCHGKFIQRSNLEDSKEHVHVDAPAHYPGYGRYSANGYATDVMKCTRTCEGEVEVRCEVVDKDGRPMGIEYVF